MWPQTRPCLGVTSPQRTTSKTDRRFSGFPSRARKDQKISPVLLSVCTPPFSAKPRLHQQMQPKPKETGRQAMTQTETHSPTPWQDNDAGLIYGQVSGDDDEAPFVCDVCDSPLDYT